MEQEYPENNTNTPFKISQSVYDWIGMLIGIITVLILCFSFIFRTVSVDGSSMTNTLQNNDRLILLEMGYAPKAGDIVVLYAPAETHPIIKRVIATAGQTVNINYVTHEVSVNGHILNEPYIREATAFEGISPVTMPTTVPAGHIFVMGDNRNNSLDSRSGAIGMISTNDVLGHAVLRFLPNSKVLKTADIAVS
ncbi:MAG TPA: signal peptidase I [Ruminococcaceae bacterium]|nr:signal peptidase I [Oscillospiraceae bacterium]